MSDRSDLPALVLLHGAGLNGRMWDPVRRHLDPRIQVLSPDLPGHGARRSERYTLAGAIDTVREAVRAAGPARVVVGGDSLGGYTSIAAASALPAQQVAGFLLGGCTLNFIGAPLWALRARGRLVLALATLIGRERFARYGTARLLRRAGCLEEDIDAILAAGIHLAAFNQAVEAIGNVDFLAMVGVIEAPILFFNGDRDRPAVAHEAQFLARARHAKARRFACEHGVSLWCAREFAAMTSAFLVELAAGAAQ